MAKKAEERMTQIRFASCFTFLLHTVPRNSDRSPPINDPSLPQPTNLLCSKHAIVKRELVHRSTEVANGDIAFA